MKNRALFAAGSFLAIIALIQLSRVFYPFEVIINGFVIPTWFSAFLFVIFGTFASWIFYAIGYKEPPELVNKNELVEQSMERKDLDTDNKEIP